jgi:hypothetical protein
MGLYITQYPDRNRNHDQYLCSSAKTIPLDHAARQGDRPNEFLKKIFEKNIAQIVAAFVFVKINAWS